MVYFGDKDTPRSSLQEFALAFGIVGTYATGVGVLAASVAGVHEGIKWFFNAPKYDSWKHFQQPGGWYGSKWETRSPFERVHGNKLLKRLGYVGYAITAYEVGSAYRDDGLSGVRDYAIEGYWDDMKLIFPWSRPLIDLLE